MKGKALLFSAIALFSFDVLATTQVPLLYCNGCTPAAKNNLALGLHTLGNIYVADVTAQNVVAFNVWTDIDDSVQPPVREWNIDTTPATEPYLSTANNLIQYYNLNPKGWAKHLNLTTSGHLSVNDTQINTVVPYNDLSKNVYDVIDQGPFQNNLTDWVVNSSRSFYTSLIMKGINMGASFHVVDMGTLPKTTVTIQFSDLSHIDVVLDFTAANTTGAIVRTSGRDSHNNNVPVTKQQATCNTDQGQGICNYNFDGAGNPTDYQRWKQRLTTLGVSLMGGGSTGTGGTWSCVTVGEGVNAVYECQFHPS